MIIYEFKFEDEIEYIHHQLRRESIIALKRLGLVCVIIFGIFYFAGADRTTKIVLGSSIVVSLTYHYYFRTFYDYASKANRIIKTIEKVPGEPVEITTLASNFIFRFLPKKKKLPSIIEVKEIDDFDYTNRGGFSLVPEGFKIGRSFSVETIDEKYYLVFPKDMDEESIDNILAKIKL